jgi:hypothetical protein
MLNGEESELVFTYCNNIKVRKYKKNALLEIFLPIIKP